jgi:hypothetical protein
MAACIVQKADQVVGAGLPSNGNGCWRVFTKVNPTIFVQSAWARAKAKEKVAAQAA